MFTTSIIVLVLAVLPAFSAPVQKLLQQRYQIISLHSSKFLSVTPNGDVHAKATDPTDPSTEFFLRTHSFPHVSYESVQNEGKYLVINPKNGEIRVEIPDGTSEKFEEIAHPSLHGFLALRSPKGCYVAFDMHGSVATEPGVCDKEILGQLHASVIIVPSSIPSSL